MWQLTKNMNLIRIIIVVFSILLINFSVAAFNVYNFDDSVKEAQFKALIKELRCPKCQNNNIADSTAPLAVDIKNYVYSSVKDGKTDDQIKDFLISRYGDFVTYAPRFKGASMLVWLLPVLILGLAIFLIVNSIKFKNKQLLKSESESINSNLNVRKSNIDGFEKSKENHDMQRNQVAFSDAQNPQNITTEKTMQEILAEIEADDKAKENIESNNNQGKN